MHYTNTALPQVFASLHCNSRGTRPTQFTLAVLENTFPETKTYCKGVLLGMDLPRWGKSAFKHSTEHSTISGKPVRYCKCNISFQRVSGISEDVVRTEEMKELDLLKRPRGKKWQKYRIQKSNTAGLFQFHMI